MPQPASSLLLTVGVDPTVSNLSASRKRNGVRVLTILSTSP
jgi:hypothetical protein